MSWKWDGNSELILYVLLRRTEFWNSLTVFFLLMVSLRHFPDALQNLFFESFKLTTGKLFWKLRRKEKLFQFLAVSRILFETYSTSQCAVMIFRIGGGGIIYQQLRCMKIYPKGIAVFWDAAWSSLTTTSLQKHTRRESQNIIVSCLLPGYLCLITMVRLVYCLVVSV